MQTKTEKVRELLRDRRFVEALKIAKGFRHLGDHKKTIQRGWDAHTNPRFARSLNRDPQALLDQAIAALLDLYPDCKQAVD
jgi:hypothetical protein